MASLTPRSGVLGTWDAAHLLRRTTFGVDTKTIKQFAQYTADQAVSILFTVPPLPPIPKDPLTGTSWVVNGRVKGVNSSKLRLRRYIIGWWLQSVLDAPQPYLHHKMEFFLHTCFTTDMYSLESEDNYYTLRLFRHYALGSYKELARKIILDNGMLRYLDTHISRRSAPNENFPREFLELFTIGKGPQVGPGDYTTYTEEDIREASRLLTGFRQNHRWWDQSLHDPDTGLPMGKTKSNSHDSGDKVFSDAFVSTEFPSPVTIKGRKGKNGMHQELDDFVDMVFAQPATARNIIRKMYRFFVHFDITQEVEDDIIEPLAALLMQKNYNLRYPLRRLLASRHFYDVNTADPTQNVRGAMIKSPLSLLVGTLKFFKVPCPDPQGDQTEFYLKWHKRVIQDFILPNAGMQLFSPPTVAGYPAYHQEPNYNQLWASAVTLPFRYNLADMFFAGKKLVEPGSFYMKIDPVAVASNKDIVPNKTAPDPYTGVVDNYAGGRFANHLVSSILRYAFPRPISTDRYKYFLDDLLLDNLSPINWRMEWVQYEKTGNASGIRPQLENLIRGILQSPEYQLE